MDDRLLRLSFCTVARGRLDHIRQTLLQNIAENAEYPDAEFVLLDYGSADGLGDWIRENAMPWIDAGRLVYIRFDGAAYYSHTHARNICFLASSGEALCNVDADNFIPRGFAFHLNGLLHQGARSFANFGRAPRNTMGRLAMFRSDFLNVGGYDEALVGWGWEDKDLRDRLRTSGCQLHWLDAQYARFVPHGDDRRVENMAPEHRHRRRTSDRNSIISRNNIAQGHLVANQQKGWGSAIVVRNFSQTIAYGIAPMEPTYLTSSGPPRRPGYMTQDHFRISFCTSAMGRIDHVRQTLFKNIADNADYPDAEFVLLDYGSKDGLGDWVRENAMPLIERGQLVYVRLDGVEHFNPAHSRNVSFLASSGAVVCNVDADNYMGESFAVYLNDLMHRHPKAMGAFNRTHPSSRGRLAMFRSDFLRLGGYDESFVGYGYEDTDLRNRLTASGCQAQWFDARFVNLIHHGDDRRVENIVPGAQNKWRTDRQHKWHSEGNIRQGQFTVNQDRPWGAAKLVRNFSQPVNTGVQPLQKSVLPMDSKRLLAPSHSGQLSPEQRDRVAAAICAKRGSNLLIFGVSDNASFWCKCNSAGHTIFIEHQQDRPAHEELGSSRVSVYPVTYSAQRGVWQDPVSFPQGWPSSLANIPWDVILVDGFGEGRDELPQAQQLIWSASQLANSQARLFVHGYQRPWDRRCADAYLGPLNYLMPGASGYLAEWRKTSVSISPS